MRPLTLGEDHGSERPDRASRKAASGWTRHQGWFPGGPARKNPISERWPSGRRRAPAKGVYGLKPVSRVRIPLSPPVQHGKGAFVAPFPCCPWMGRFEPSDKG